VRIVLDDDLGHQVERASGDDDVVDRVDLGELVGDRLDGAAHRDGDERLAGEADLHRVGHRDDLHDARVDELLHALPHRGLGQPDRLADRRVRAAAVLLQLFDDRPGRVVEVIAAPGARHDVQNYPSVA
jgi:hypothetical protein